MGGASDQVVEPLPAEDVAVEEHLLEALAQGGIGVFHQPPGEVGVGGAKDLELGINAEGDALQGHQGADDQGVVRRHLEGEAIHHAGKVICDRFEIHAADSLLDRLTEHLFKSRHYRLEIYVFGQEAQADEILT